MSIFLIYKANFADEEIERGINLIKSHYDLKDDFNYDSFNADGLGCWFSWGKYDNQKQYRYSREEDCTAFLTHIPSGYSRIITARPGDKDFAAQIGKTLRDDPEKLSRFGGPFSSVISNRKTYVRIAVDGVGIGRVFHYRTERGHFFSNRPIAAILFSGEVPRPSELGWASHLTFGYFWGSLTAFEGMTMLTAGQHISLTKNEICVGAVDALKRWTDGDAEPLFEGFDRHVGEMQDALTLDELTVNLSGGRDSRAISALMSAHFGDRVLLATSYPPLVERDASANIVSKLPYFDHFENENSAWSNSRQIWRASERRNHDNKLGLRERGRLFIRHYETTSLSTHMARPFALPPTIAKGHLSPGLGGDAGEISKAYGWADTKHPGPVKKAIRATALPNRLVRYALTSDQSHGMLTGQRYTEVFWPMINDQRRHAAEVGLWGYRYLNYHYLLTRVGRASAMGFHDMNIMLFLGTHYISAALRQDNNKLIAADMHRKIIEHYRPEWAGEPFESEMQDKPERRVNIPPKLYLWCGPDAREFTEIINERSYFGEPYDHDAILQQYGVIDGNEGMLNVRGFDLVHRAAFIEFLEELRQEILQAKQ